RTASAPLHPRQALQVQGGRAHEVVGPIQAVARIAPASGIAAVALAAGWADAAPDDLHRAVCPVLELEPLPAGGARAVVLAAALDHGEDLPVDQGRGGLQLLDDDGADGKRRAAGGWPAVQIVAPRARQVGHALGAALLDDERLPLVKALEVALEG